MKLTVNGDPYEHLSEATVAALLCQLGANPNQTAVMVNDEVIPMAKRESHGLKESDRVEVITFAGGG